MSLNSFPCPVCAAKMGIVDSRPTPVLGCTGIRRRRKCFACDHRITTYEVQDEAFEKASDAYATSTTIYAALKKLFGQLETRHVSRT